MDNYLNLHIDEQIDYLKKGAEDLIGEADLRTKLEKSQKDGIPLKVKLGADPTAPDIHLGHTVVIRKLRAFQELGHHVIFLIGDFTGMIGDPSGRSKTRPRLSKKEIDENARTYESQIYKILLREKTEIRRNSEWFSNFKAEDFIKLASQITVSKILERNDFHKRWESEKPIFFHELLYPLIQAYDSVALEADVELGGTDQKFNLLLGRELQVKYNKEPQVVITMPLLEGTDGVQKMSKSLNNYIGINEPPSEMYRKIMMDVSDKLMWRYYELLTDLSPKEIKKIKAALEDEIATPNQIKDKLAKLIIKDFHSEDEAINASIHYKNSTLSGIITGPSPLKHVRARKTNIAYLLVESGLSKSIKEISKNPRAKICFEEMPVQFDAIKTFNATIQENSIYKLQYGKNALDLKGVLFSINHEKAISETVETFGYDEKFMLLEIRFTKSGKLYEYYDVPISIYFELKNLVERKAHGDKTASVGNYFNKKIRNEYRNLEIKE